MKRIGLFLDTLPSNGGVFQYNLSMLEAVASLPRDEYDLVVAYTSPQWREHLVNRDIPSLFINYHFSARLLSIWLNLFNLPVTTWQKLTPKLFRYGRVLLDQHCDLWIFPSQDAVSYQVNLPAVVTILDLAHRYVRRFPESASRFEYLIRERNYRNICRCAQGVIVDSVTGGRQVTESYGLPADRVHRLPYAAPRYMDTGRESEDGVASAYRLPDKYLFYPAQFWEHKNHRNLIRAMALLKNELPDIKLVLTGSPKNAYASVVALVNELNLGDSVLFLGYAPNREMPELFRRARALVMPTYFGPSNIPPLEAISVGCPVAISTVSGMPEQLGDAALRFDPDTVEEIADCIRRLWTDDQLCARLAENGRRQAALWGQKEFNDRLAEIVARVLHHQPDH